MLSKNFVNNLMHTQAAPELIYHCTVYITLQSHDVLRMILAFAKPLGLGKKNWLPTKGAKTPLNTMHDLFCLEVVTLLYLSLVQEKASWN